MAQRVVEVQEPGRAPLRLVMTGPLVIGRDCDGLLLTDGQISRRHLELRPVANGVELTDLGSSNGTYIAGAKVNGPVVLRPGELARFGASTISVVIDQPPVTAMARATMIGPAPYDGRGTMIEHVAALVTADQALDHEHRQGTITIVFSDIEGSTERVGRMGDSDWMDLLTVHNAIIRTQVRRYEGTEVKHQGDGFMLTFPSARRAVQAMVAVQQEFASSDVRERTGGMQIRVGMHTGEVIVDDGGDVFGHHVHVAARVAGKALGGEILVSALTNAILASRTDIAFGEPREVEFKGVEGVHTVHPVIWPGGSSRP
jgi:class 3 adenylate cyclase